MRWRGGAEMLQSPSRPIAECFAFTKKNARHSLNDAHTEQATPCSYYAAGQPLSIGSGRLERITEVNWANVTMQIWIALKLIYLSECILVIAGPIASRTRSRFSLVGRAPDQLPARSRRRHIPEARQRDWSHSPACPDICTICLEDLEEGEGTYRLSCTHSFHFPCIAEWLYNVVNEARWPQCPNCRACVPLTHWVSTFLIPQCFGSVFFFRKPFIMSFIFPTASISYDLCRKGARYSTLYAWTTLRGVTMGSSTNRLISKS